MSELYKKDDDWNGENHALVEICELPITTIETIYNSVCRINQLFKEHKISSDTYEKEVLVQRVLQVYKERLEESSNYIDAANYSALAWLYLHLNDKVNAKKAVTKGLSIDANNYHCLKLKDMLV